MAHLFTPPSKIYVTGVGDGGIHVLDRLIADGMSAAQCIAINTDQQMLTSSKAGHHLLIGENATAVRRRSGDSLVVVPDNGGKPSGLTCA